jgi:D-alanyl-D-alanine carboxypeptidase
VKGKISTGTVPEGLEPIYVHRQSRTLSEILVELLRASNNYIANQVFLEIGAHRLGGPVSRKKSLQVAMLAAAMGSGISRNKRLHPTLRNGRESRTNSNTSQRTQALVIDTWFNWSNRTRQ